MVRKGRVEPGEPSEERRAEVLVEELKSEFKVVLDGQAGLRETFTRLEGTFANLETTVNRRHLNLKKYLKDGLEKVYGDLGNVERKLDKLAERFDVHERAHAS